MLVTSIFSFYQNVFYPIKDRNHLFCQNLTTFEFGQVEHLSFGKEFNIYFSTEVYTTSFSLFQCIKILVFIPGNNTFFQTVYMECIKESMESTSYIFTKFRTLLCLAHGHSNGTKAATDLQKC